jgi:serine/threonine protein kinase
MLCPSCGQQNSPGARFCVFCGAVLEDEPRTLQAGQRVDGGTYRIIRPLGKGGMGAVYLAANTKAFDRPCVVKEVIQYYDPTDPEARQKAIERFEAEARTLASLKHSGIPDIYAYFTENGRNYLVMEYIEGPNLAQGLTREEGEGSIPGSPQPLEDVVKHCIQICEVLTYLQQHQPPVIHNDIKPANIILDKNTGQAVLVDFGTAKTRYASQGAGKPGRQHSSVYGTVGYAAPELYEGRAEPRSDVYALAATAYHLLTDDDPRGHPFKFPNMNAVPMPFRQALLDALEVDVRKRITARQFSERLQRALQPASSQPISAPLAPPLTFPDGGKATTRQELIALSVKHLEYAAEILYDGSLMHWLRDALHDPIAAKAAGVAVAQYPDTPAAGLEQWIRSLDPQALPAPKLKVVNPKVQYDPLARDGTPLAIKVANTGGGYLYGKVTYSEPWLKIDHRLKCGPGETQSLPVFIDLEELTPGKTYRAQVSIEATGGQSASVQIEASIPPPRIDITPMQIDLGTVSRKQLFTEKASFKVKNAGQTRAVCHIEGIPPWLVLDPTRFICLPGQTQNVELIGRVDLVPAQGQRHDAMLYVNIEGRHPRQVQVVLRTRTGQKRKGRLGSALTIAIALLVLVGAIAWFMIAVLPVLLP